MIETASLLSGLETLIGIVVVGALLALAGVLTLRWRMPMFQSRSTQRSTAAGGGSSPDPPLHDIGR